MKPSPLDVLPFVEAYEIARQSTGYAAVREHLPPRNHRGYLFALAELLRVDLEYEWASGRRRLLSDYLREFPDLRTDADLLAAVAYEEFRQRLDYGEVPNPVEYSKQYGIDTHGWAFSEVGQVARSTAHDWSEDVVEAARTVRVELGPKQPVPEPMPSLVNPTVSSPVLDLFHDLKKSAPAVAERLAEAVASFPKVGDEFLGFRLTRELGRGSFARVFLAEQADLAGRLVALKVTTDLTGEPQTLAQLQHTNIVPIYSVHYRDCLQAVCMPYFGATTLADVVANINSGDDFPQTGKLLVSTMNNRRASTRTGSARPDDKSREHAVPSGVQADTPHDSLLSLLANMTHTQAMLWIAARLAEGLSHAHERGIQHRDLKPANVLITDEGQPMLLDFNLAENSSQNGPHSVGGTLAYMAPEHLESFAGGRGVVDARADLYSLGLILFEMLTGRQAFPRTSGTGAFQIRELIRQRKAGPPQLRHFNATVTADVESIVRKCLEPEAKQRYRSADELREDLERHLADLPLKFAKNNSLVERAKKWTRRNPHLTSTTAVAAVSLFVLLATGIAVAGWRENLRSLSARQSYRDSQQELADARSILYRREPTREELDEGLARARACLDRYEVLAKRDWESQPNVRYLPESDRDRLREDMGESLYLLAKGTSDWASRESPDRRPELVSAALEFNGKAASLGEQLTRAVTLQKADLLDKSGRAVEADELRKSARQARSGGPRDLYLLGHEYAKRGEYTRAIPVLAEATRLDPKSFSAWFVRGMCHHSRMQFDRAAECFTACLALKPNDARAWQNRGLTAFKQKRIPEAIADLDRAIELLPGQPDLHQDRAVLQSAIGHHTEAIADFTTALELGSSRTSIYFLRAIAKRKNGDRAGAEADRALGRQLIPTDEGSWLALAQDRATRDRVAALGDADEALKINPISSAALQFRSHLLAELGRTDEAGQALDKAVELYPDHAPFWCGRAVHRARLGQRDPALADAREALGRDTSASNLYQAAGVFALTSATHPDDALDAYRYLRAALAAGFGHELLAIDTDLDPIRKQPEFAALEKLARVQKATAKAR